eukprot:TRINITY_DN5787_c0_g1_i3.p2 TRINITY_DN5787_c0_g1~~TRINITY_DN5787_c0_g1_i3.p2  ORF type:complete len:132 (+),score=29.30 TRINITY_DN5787_c0_g1_i3:266-661(+)
MGIQRKMEEIKVEVFRKMDQNNDGIIDKEELIASLKQACASNPSAEADSILSGKSGISFEEYSKADKSSLIYALSTFVFCDKNKDGKISKKEFLEMAAKLQPGLKADKIFHKIDANSDDFLSYEELKKFFL